MPALVTIRNGQFQDGAGNLIAGTLVLQLSQDAVVSGTGQVAPKAISIVVAAGQAAATPVWGNDNLTPSGTTYTARLFDTSGALVWGPENWSITGAGPIEINTLVPASGSVSYTGAVVLAPSGDQTITTNNLLPASGNTTQALGSTAAPWVVKSSTEATANAGVFTNTQMNQYDTSIINSLNTSTEFQGQQGGFATEAVTGGVSAGGGSTVHQVNGVAGYAVSAAASTNPVGVYGQARSNGSNVPAWGGNFLVSSTVSSTTNEIIGVEVDVNANNIGDAGEAILINGAFGAATPNIQAILISKPSGGTWANGVRFQAGCIGTTGGASGLSFIEGATVGVNSSTAAISLAAIAAGTNQPSQGIYFLSNDPVSGHQAASVNATARGDLSIVTGAASSGLSVTGGNGTTIRLMDVSATHTNWLIGAQNNVNNGLEITPSTAVGGSTFSTPLVTVTAAATNVKRLGAHQGTALVLGDFAASANWGTTPTIAVVGGTDQAGSVTVTAKATTGANPTLTLTFHDGAWTTAPIVVAHRTDIAAATGAPSASVTNMWHVTSVSTTQVVFTFLGTPVANNVYGLSFICMGV